MIKLTETETQKVIHEPVEAGWTVNVDGVQIRCPSKRSPRRAAARDLTLRLAERGREIESELRLRDGAAGATFICFSPLEHGRGPLTLKTLRAPFDRRSEVL